MTWAPTVSLGELAVGGLFTDGDWVESKNQDPSGTVRLTQLADVGVGSFRNRSDRWMRVDQADALGCTYLQPGDVLIARMPDPIGRACLVPTDIGDAVTAVDVAVLRPNRPDVDSRFLMWAINTPRFRSCVEALQSGTTRKRISRKNLATLTVPLPPLDEQRRIVELLEDHLSRLDAAIASIHVSLRRLDVLRRLLVKEVAIGDVVTLKQLAIHSGYGTSVKCEVGGAGPAVVRIPNLIGGRIDLSDEKRAVDASADLSSVMLVPGDVLIIRTNGSKDLIGRSGVVQDGVNAAFASYLIRYQVDTSRLRPEWLHAMLGSPALRAEIERLAASSAGQHNLSLGKLDGLQIPTPSLEEQDAGLIRLAALDDQVGALRKALDVALRRGEGLRRSLLAAAYSGNLTSSRLAVPA